MPSAAAEEAVLYPVIADKVNEHMRDHALDEHESLALFSSDLEGMKVDEEGYDDKIHQLMEVGLLQLCLISRRSSQGR